MGRELTFVIEPEADATHPAVQAWLKTDAGNAAPVAVETLRTDNGRPYGKSSIYRLQGVGRAGGSVVAKRARLKTAAVERVIYGEILPKLSISRLHLYGFLEEHSSGWLFLEEAGGVAFSEGNAEHRSLAANWLGRLHAETSRLGKHAGLPSLDPAGSLDRYLIPGRESLRQYRMSTFVPRMYREVFDEVVSLCEILAGHWTEVARVCGLVPACLVHEDFVEKNLRVRMANSNPSLLVMDWEIAGWGSPVTDIGFVDPLLYWTEVRDEWPDLQLSQAREVAAVGRLVYCAGLMEAASRGLEWIDGAMIDLYLCEEWMSSALKELGW